MWALSSLCQGNVGMPWAEPLEPINQDQPSPHVPFWAMFWVCRTSESPPQVAQSHVPSSYTGFFFESVILIEHSGLCILLDHGMTKGGLFREGFEWSSCVELGGSHLWTWGPSKNKTRQGLEDSGASWRQGM